MKDYQILIGAMFIAAAILVAGVLISGALISSASSGVAPALFGLA